MKKYIFITLLILSILILSGIYECPLYFWLGIPCPLCGMTRAMKSLLHGSINDAFYYHPLWPIPVLMLITAIVVHLKSIKLSNKTINIASAIIGIIFLLCYIVRHSINSPIVQPNYSHGVIFNLINL